MSPAPDPRRPKDQEPHERKNGLGIEFLAGNQFNAVNAVKLATPLLTGLRPRPIDEDTSHRLGRGGEEMAAAIPVLSL